MRCVLHCESLVSTTNWKFKHFQFQKFAFLRVLRFAAGKLCGFMSLHTGLSMCLPLWKFYFQLNPHPDPPLRPLHFGLLFCVFSFPSFPHSSFFSPSLCLLFPPPASSVQTFAGISLQLCSATDWKTGFKKKPHLFIILIWPTHTLFLKVCVGLRDPIPSSTFHTVCLMIRCFVQTAVLEHFNLVKAGILWLLQNFFSSLLFSDRVYKLQLNFFVARFRPSALCISHNLVSHTPQAYSIIMSRGPEAVINRAGV